MEPRDDIAILWEVDWSTIQLWTILSKNNSKKASKFPFINSLKILGCSTKRDSLLLETLRNVIAEVLYERETF